MIAEHPGYNGEIHLDGANKAVKCKVKFENNTYLTVREIGRQSISIYAFNRHMLSNHLEQLLPIEVNYFLSGPQIGSYHDIQDPREGPYVNHYIENVNVQIIYEKSEIKIVLKGTADLSKSNIDPYWYSGRKVGIWGFFLQFGIPNL